MGACGHSGCIIGVLPRVVLDRKKAGIEARRDGGWNAELGAEEHGLCNMDGLYLHESGDGYGRRILFSMAQCGELVAVV